MNRIKTSDVLDPLIQQPFTARSLDFLQDANKDMVKGMVLNLIGKIYDPNKYYIVSGLYNYGTNQYKEGYIFFNGELYYCAGKSTTAAIVNTLELTIDTTTSIGSPYDPLKFTDDVPRTVHLQRRFVLNDAVLGSGTVNLFNCIAIDTPLYPTPVFKAYNASVTEIVGGFTAAGYNYCDLAIGSNRVHVRFRGEGFTIAASVRSLTVQLTLPFSLPAGRQLYGSAMVALNQAGTNNGWNGYAEMSDIGLITIRRLESNTDFAATPAATGGIIFNLVAYIS